MKHGGLKNKTGYLFFLFVFSFCLAITSLADNVEPNQQVLEAVFKYSKQFKLDPFVVLAVLKVESNFNVSAVNKRTHDYGIGQINIRTINAYHFDKNRLLTEVDYSILSTVKVLKWFQKTYSKQEPHNWVCRYNVGTGSLVNAKLVSCKRYLVKLSAIGTKVVEK